jgi:sugar phosphate isomerase/epimerase
MAPAGRVCQGFHKKRLPAGRGKDGFFVVTNDFPQRKSSASVMLSFSTSWNARRKKHGEEIVREILDLGFDTIELGHGLKAPVVQEILEAQKKLHFRVSSLHNFCPLPPEVLVDQPDCYEYTSHRQADRERAVRLTLQTIDMAERFAAGTVVIHSGRVRTLGVTEPLIDLVESGKFLGKEYGRAKVEAVKKREAVGEFYIQRALECLTEIADYASKKGIRLGLENREDYEAVPSEREFENFLQRLDAPNAGYWHDFGHAQIKHNLALLNHSEWLARIGSRAIGCHLHDVKWPFDDHRAPFTGEIPFPDLVSKLPKGCLFVFEMHPRVTREDIIAAVERWKTLFGS